MMQEPQFYFHNFSDTEYTEIKSLLNGTYITECKESSNRKEYIFGDTELRGSAFIRSKCLTIYSAYNISSIIINYDESLKRGHSDIYYTLTIRINNNLVLKIKATHYDMDSYGPVSNCETLRGDVTKYLKLLGITLLNHIKFIEILNYLLDVKIALAGCGLDNVLRRQSHRDTIAKEITGDHSNYSLLTLMYIACPTEST